jgi:hypothetical protein
LGGGVDERILWLIFVQQKIQSDQKCSDLITVSRLCFQQTGAVMMMMRIFCRMKEMKGIGEKLVPLVKGPFTKLKLHESTEVSLSQNGDSGPSLRVSMLKSAFERKLQLLRARFLESGQLKKKLLVSDELRKTSMLSAVAFLVPQGCQIFLGTIFQ